MSNSSLPSDPNDLKPIVDAISQRYFLVRRWAFWAFLGGFAATLGVSLKGTVTYAVGKAQDAMLDPGFEDAKEDALGEFKTISESSAAVEGAVARLGATLERWVAATDAIDVASIVSPITGNVAAAADDICSAVNNEPTVDLDLPGSLIVLPGEQFEVSAPCRVTNDAGCRLHFQALSGRANVEPLDHGNTSSGGPSSALVKPGVRYRVTAFTRSNDTMDRRAALFRLEPIPATLQGATVRIWVQ